MPKKLALKRVPFNVEELPRYLAETIRELELRLDDVLVTTETIYIEGTPSNWGSISGTLSDQTDLWSELGDKLEDAPDDTNEYVRQGGQWVVNTGGSAGGGDVFISGTPADNRVAVWVSGTSIEGDANFTWNGTTQVLAVAGDINVDDSTNPVTVDIGTSATSGPIGLGIGGAFTGGGFNLYQRDSDPSHLRIEDTSATTALFDFDESGNFRQSRSGSLSTVIDSAGGQTINGALTATGIITANRYTATLGSSSVWALLLQHGTSANSGLYIDVTEDSMLYLRDSAANEGVILNSNGTSTFNDAVTINGNVDISGTVEIGSNGQQLFDIDTTALRLRSANATATSLRLATSDSVTRGALYANSSGEVGILDDDLNWAYRHTTDTEHDWLTNNTVRMTLTNAHELAIDNGLAVKGNTLSTGASASTQWAKIAQVEIDTRYHDVTLPITLVGRAHSEGRHEIQFVVFRVKQQNDFGADPTIDLENYYYDDTAPHDVGYVIVQHSPSTIVELYVQVNGTYTAVDYYCDNISTSGVTADEITWYNEQAFAASVTDLVESTARQYLFDSDIGTTVQAQDAGLQYLADLAITNQATFQEQVGLEIGVDVQAYDANTAKTDEAANFTAGLQSGGFDVLTTNSGTGTVDTTGTPAVNQLAYFADADTIQGDANLTWNGTTFALTGDVDLDGSLGFSSGATSASVDLVTGTLEYTVGGTLTARMRDTELNVLGTTLTVGVNDSTSGRILLYGDSASQGGRVFLYNSAFEDAVVEYYSLEANGGSLLFTQDGSTIAAFDSDGTASIGGNEILTDLNGLPLTGGTISGSLTVQGQINVGQNGGGNSIIQFYDDSSNAWRELRYDDTTNQFQVDAGGAENQDLLHEGNWDDYAEPALGNPSTDGEVLTSTAAGVRSWSPAFKFELISETSITATSVIEVDLINPATYIGHVIFIEDARPATDNASLCVQFRSATVTYNGNGDYRTGIGADTAGTVTQLATDYINITGSVGTANDEGCSARIETFGFSGTDSPPGINFASSYITGGALYHAVNGVGVGQDSRMDTDQIRYIRFLWSSGNFENVSGRILVYGIRN